MFANRALPEMPSIFGAFAVQRRSNGKVDLLELEFPLSTSPSGTRSIGEAVVTTRFEGLTGMFMYHHSRGDCLPEDLTRRVHPDMADTALLPGIDDVFDAARKKSKSCGEEVGGAIDVAVIDSGGFRWIRRKPITL
jgi:hypothetical protein